MEANNVIKFILFLVFFTMSKIIFGQRSKYLLFDTSKDTIIMQEKIFYYKIDNNLFDINRYNTRDTINLEKFAELKINTVDKLWSEGKDLFIDVSKEKNLFIETYNEIFEEIYVLEKISNCTYKRTRVWWVDY